LTSEVGHGGMNQCLVIPAGSRRRDTTHGASPGHWFLQDQPPKLLQDKLLLLERISSPHAAVRATTCSGQLKPGDRVASAMRNVAGRRRELDRRVRSAMNRLWCHIHRSSTLC